MAIGVLIGALVVAAPEPARADVIASVNNVLLNIFQSTSASLIDGPPEVAREIAMIDGSVFDAVKAAGGLSGASADAAALQAAITVMNSLYQACAYQKSHPIRRIGMNGVGTGHAIRTY